MTVIVMAFVGFIAGFPVDTLIARLAREPFERGVVEEDDLRLKKSPLALNSETGAFAMPSLLTTASWYRRAVVVALTTVVFALLGRAYAGDDLHVAIVAAYAAVLIVCAGTDVLAYRVPNIVTYPAIVGAIAIGLAIPNAQRFDVIAGGILFGGLLFVPSLITGGAMGMGDVKLAFFVGFALGLAYVVPAMLIMAIAGGIGAAVMLVTRVRGRGDPIPYAPFIAAGALVVMLMQGTAFRAL